MPLSNSSENTAVPQPAKRAGLASRMFITPLLPVPRPRRLFQLFLGLYLFGLGAALQVAARLGANPWDVLHQGLHLRTGWSIGTWSILLGVVVVLLWLPLRQRAGLGTISNVVIIGLSLDSSLLWLPEPESLVTRSLMLVLSIVFVAVGSGLYIGTRLGPGPRDGLMTGLAARGLSIRLARTLIEAVVLVAGFLLGGTVGVGTLLFMVAIGPLAQVFIPMFDVEKTVPR